MPGATAAWASNGRGVKSVTRSKPSAATRATHNSQLNTHGTGRARRIRCSVQAHTYFAAPRPPPLPPPSPLPRHRSCYAVHESAPDRRPLTILHRGLTAPSLPPARLTRRRHVSSSRGARCSCAAHEQCADHAAARCFLRKAAPSANALSAAAVVVALPAPLRSEKPWAWPGYDVMLAGRPALALVARMPSICL